MCPESTYALSISKGIENPNSGSLKVLHVPSSDRQVVASRDRRDIAVLNRHEFPGRLKLVLLISPHMSDRHVESKNSTVHRLGQFRQPFLQRRTLLSALGSHPKRQLSNDN